MLRPVAIDLAVDDMDIESAGAKDCSDGEDGQRVPRVVGLAGRQWVDAGKQYDLVHVCFPSGCRWWGRAVTAGSIGCGSGRVAVRPVVVRRNAGRVRWPAGRPPRRGAVACAVSGDGVCGPGRWRRPSLGSSQRGLVTAVFGMV